MKTFARLTLVPWLLSALVGAGCQRGGQAQAATAQQPADEAWLKPAQVQASKIEIRAVGEENVDDTILTSGKVSFDDSKVAHIYTPVSGRVSQILAQLGQRVKKGDPLCVIDSPDIGVASSDVGKAQADTTAAEHEYARQRELYSQHATSQRDFETAEDNYRKTRAELERARQKQRLFRGGAVDAVSQTYTVRAPIDGEVVARMVNPGMEVQGQYGGGTPVELYTVGELDQVWVMADVFEMDLARVHKDAPITVRVVAYPNRTFTGKVDWISGTLDPATRAARVRCTLDNQDLALKPEMYATVSVSVDQQRALAVPRPAILRLGDQTVVFVEKGSTQDGRLRFERVPVSVDEGEGGPWVVVKHGLDKGTKVVVSGAILVGQAMGGQG